MSAPWILARNTFREAVRDRLLATALVFGGLLVATSIGLAPLALGEQERVVRDLGLSAVSAFTLLLIILVGTGMVYREIERRTIDTILTQPIGRSDFLLGKFFGLYAAMLTCIAVLGVVYLVVVALFGGGVRPGILFALGLTALEAMIVTALAILFSSMASPLLSAVFTFGVVVAGYLAGDLRALAEGTGNAALSLFTRAMYFMLPALHQFDVRNNVLSGQPVALEQIGACTVYAVLYTAAVLVVAVVVFQRRDFE